MSILKTSPANLLTHQILKHLFEHGIFAWRQNTAGMPVRKGGIVVAMKTSGKTGVPDICSIWPPTGRFVGFEVKVGADRLRPEQVGFHESCRHVGAEAVVVKTWEDYLIKFGEIYGETHIRAAVEQCH